MNRLFNMWGRIGFAVGLGIAALLNGCTTGTVSRVASQTLKSEPFGKAPDGTPVEIFTLRNDNDMTVRIMTYGGIVQSLIVPDQSGHPGDVVLGYDTLDGYLTNSPYFGALIGRYG